MTLENLSELRFLKEQLRKDESMLASFWAKASPGAQALTGMPHSTDVSDRVGNLAIEIADMEERIRYLKEAIAQKETEIQDFIKAVENDQARMIFRLRFIRGLTWGEVAGVIGGGNTDDSVKKVCYRYLEAQSVINRQTGETVKGKRP